MYLSQPLKFAQSPAFSGHTRAASLLTMGFKPFSAMHQELDMDEDFSFRDIVELAQDVVIVTRAEPLDAPGPEIVYVNPAFTRLTGYTREEAIGRNPRLLQGAETDPKTTRLIRSALDKAEPVHVAIEDYTKDGRTYWLDMSIMPLRNAQGRLTHFVAIERDVSTQQALERKLAELAERDPLTALFNRRKFYEALDSAWLRLTTAGTPFAVIGLDLDEFKGINDQHGHDSGDTVLQAVATLIQKSCRPHDTAARTGGEEFAIILADVTSAQAAVEAAESLRKSIEATPILLPSRTISITASLGVALADKADESPAQVTKRADMALYQSKQTGRNRTTFLPTTVT